jgi:hypothetical protein
MPRSAGIYRADAQHDTIFLKIIEIPLVLLQQRIGLYYHTIIILHHIASQLTAITSHLTAVTSHHI